MTIVRCVLRIGKISIERYPELEGLHGGVICVVVCYVGYVMFAGSH